MMKRLILAAAVALSPVVHAASTLACGIPPIPPVGCKVGPCVCDQYGQNCRYTFICG